MVLSEKVSEEVWRNLPDVLRAEFDDLVRRSRPEVVPAPSEKYLSAALGLIRHDSDLPVLLSAMASRPDWLLTNNTKHFTPSVARRTGLRIATPRTFMRELVRSESRLAGRGRPRQARGR